jgi:hypothetical protein
VRSTVIPQVQPVLSDDEKIQITSIVDALLKCDKATLERVPKSPLYRDDVFWECYEYVKIDESDRPDDLCGEIIQIKTSPVVGYDLLLINLKRHEQNGKNQIQIGLTRDAKGGNLRINSIGDIESVNEGEA